MNFDRLLQHVHNMLSHTIQGSPQLRVFVVDFRYEVVQGTEGNLTPRSMR